MKVILTLLLLLALPSCDKDPFDEPLQKQEKAKTSTQSNYPFIIDEKSKEQKILKQQAYLREGNYNPLYIGPITDTLSLNYTMQFKEYFVYEGPQYPLCWVEENSKLSIEVDTAHIIGNSDWLRTHEDWKRVLYQAYPVYITNLSPETYFIGYGIHVPFTLEAKNKLGGWQTIEDQYIYGCGTGLNMTLLPSNHLLVTSVPLFEGNFQTELRLKLGNHYSAPFTGKIFQSQFESEYDLPIY